MDKSLMDTKVNEMFAWIQTQAHLPQKIEYNFLKLFLLSKGLDVEAAKSLLEYHFKFRLKHKNLFLKRDPLDSATKQELEVANVLQLPGRTANNYKLFLLRLNDYDPSKFNHFEMTKVFFMYSDLFAIHDEQDHEGEVIIFDMSGLTLRHLWKVSFANVRIFMKGIQEVLPLRTKEIHIVNATNLVETLVGWVKPLMDNDFASKIHIHLPDSETAYDYFSRDLLPEEYGGKAGSVAELKSFWINKVFEERDYLMDASRWRIKAHENN